MPWLVVWEFLTSKISLIVIGIILVVGTIFYYQHRVDKLTNEKKELIVSAQLQEQTIKNLESDITKIQSEYKNYQDQMKEAIDSSNQLRDKLYREIKKKKTLEQVTISAPEQVEKRINIATKQVFDSIEQITGAQTK